MLNYCSELFGAMFDRTLIVRLERSYPMKGRPKSAHPSVTPLTIYVTEAQYEEITQQAEAAKRSISRHAKRLLLLGAKVEQPDDATLPRSA